MLFLIGALMLFATEKSGNEASVGRWEFMPFVMLKCPPWEVGHNCAKCKKRSCTDTQVSWCGVEGEGGVGVGVE